MKHRFLPLARLSALLFCLLPHPSSGMVEIQGLLSSDGQSVDDFGWSVDIDGNTMVVGAPFVDVNGGSTQGAVYLHPGPGGGAVATPAAVAQRLAVGPNPVL